MHDHAGIERVPARPQLAERDAQIATGDEVAVVAVLGAGIVADAVAAAFDAAGRGAAVAGGRVAVVAFLGTRIVDDAVADPRSLVDGASGVQYSAGGPYYPGVRADAGENYRAALAQAALPLIRNVFGIEAPQWQFECFFSLVTLTPEMLTLIQRLPHYDGVEDQRFAALLFLCDAKFGGTAFYRHCATGFETVNAERFPVFKHALEDRFPHVIDRCLELRDSAKQKRDEKR